MRRGRAGAAVLAGLVAIGGTGVVLAGRGSSASSPPRRTGVATTTATVQRTTLVERDEVDGTLGYGEVRSVVSRAAGTLTALPPVGSTIERNGVVYGMDGRPVRLLYGKVPAYRRLAAGVEDGPDVEQLEQNLKEMGFAAGLFTRPDRRWDSATTAALKRWQKSLGDERDGAVEDGEVVFFDGAVRVAGHEAEAGSTLQPGAAVLDVTGTTRQVDVDLDARRQRLARPGAAVEIRLPDDTTLAGTIAHVGTVASDGSDGDAGSGGDDDPTIDVVVALAGAGDGAGNGSGNGVGASLDGAPVKVLLTSRSKEGVLAVPVQALLALAEGGYAVEVAGGAGRLFRVETGLFSEGLVEVSGAGIFEGMKVVIPR